VARGTERQAARRAGRERFGICRCMDTARGLVLIASEIKGVLASGMSRPARHARASTRVTFFSQRGRHRLPGGAVVAAGGTSCASSSAVPGGAHVEEPGRNGRSDFPDAARKTPSATRRSWWTLRGADAAGGGTTTNGCGRKCRCRLLAAASIPDRRGPGQPRPQEAPVLPSPSASTTRPRRDRAAAVAPGPHGAETERGEWGFGRGVNNTRG